MTKGPSANRAAVSMRPEWETAGPFVFQGLFMAYRVERAKPMTAPRIQPDLQRRRILQIGRSIYDPRMAASLRSLCGSAELFEKWLQVPAGSRQSQQGTPHTETDKHALGT